jgi:hypothetical protein
MTQERCVHVLQPMVANGVVWVDSQPQGEKLFYLPALWFEHNISEVP